MRDITASAGVPDPVRDSQFYAGVPMRRLVSFVIDMAVILGLWVLVFLAGMVLSVVTLGAGTPIAFGMFSATGFLYRWIMLMRRSATLGMILTGIEVRDSNGDRVSEITAFLHTAAFYVTLFFPPLLVIGWILMAASPYRRAMHDIVLGTVVINRPA